MGIANRLIAADEWEVEVAAFAERLAAMPTKAIGLIKRSLNAASELSYEEFLRT